MKRICQILLSIFAFTIPGYPATNEPFVETSASSLPVAPTDLEDAPILKFGGLRQADAPQPLWSVALQPALSINPGTVPDRVLPTVSADGKWLVIAEETVFKRLGKWVCLINLETHQIVKELQISPNYIVSQLVFTPSRNDLIQAIVNNSNGCSLATWTVPDLKDTVLDLGFGKAINAVFSHSGDKVVVRGENKIIGVFDTTSGTKLLEVTSHTNDAVPLNGIAISWDDEIVTSGRSGSQLNRWKMEDGTELAAPVLCQYIPWGLQGEYSRDNTKLISLAQSLTILDAQSGTPLCLYSGNRRISFSYNPVQSLVAAAIGKSGEASFGVVAVNSGKLVMWAEQPVEWTCISPDGRTLYTSYLSGIAAWDIAAELAKSTDWLFAGQYVVDIAVSPDGEWLNAAGNLMREWNHRTRLDTWNLRTRSLFCSRQLAQLQPICDSTPNQSHDRWRLLATYTMGGNIYAILKDRQSEGVELFDTAKDEIVLKLGLSAQEAWAELNTQLKPGAAREETEAAARHAAAQVFPNESMLNPFTVVASKDGARLLVTNPKNQGVRASLWSLETGRLLNVLGQDLPAACAAIFTGDEHKIVTGDEAGTIVILDSISGAVLQTIPGTGSQVRIGPYLGSTILVLASNEDGSMIYTSDHTGTVTGWILHDGNSKLLFKQILPEPPECLALSPNGKLLAVCPPKGSSNGRIVILDAETGEVLKVLDENAHSALFLSNEQLVTSGIRIWSINLQ